MLRFLQSGDTYELLSHFQQLLANGKPISSRKCTSHSNLGQPGKFE